VDQPSFDEVLQAVRERHVSGAMLRRLLEMGSGNRAAVNALQALLKELDKILPGDFLKRVPRAFIQQLPRYLQALQIRGERAYAAPEKDRAKGEHLAPHQERFVIMQKVLKSKPSAEKLRFMEEFRAVLEEFKISLFAPEVRTRYRVSGKRLDVMWQEWVKLTGASAA
jgi:ATP-dependent helicase HrpA